MRFFMRLLVIFLVLMTIPAYVWSKALTAQEKEEFANVKIICVVVEQSYKKADKINLPFKETLEKFLTNNNFQISSPESKKYDAILTVKVEGKALSERYVPGSSLYGVSLKGKVLFKTQTGAEFEEEFECTVYPPYEISDWLLEIPNDIPFKKAFYHFLANIPVILEKIISINIIDWWNTLLKDENSSVRTAVANVLGEMKDPRGVEPLIGALKDKDEDVRWEIICALDEINPEWRNTEEAKRKIPEFIATLKNEDKDFRTAVIEVLGEIKDPRAIEPLITTLKDKDENIRWEVIWALDEINPEWRNTEEAKRKVIEFIADLKNEDENIRTVAIEALGEIKDPLGVEPLIIALEDESSIVREKAVSALKEITSQDFGNNSTKWQKWWKKNKNRFLK